MGTTPETKPTTGAENVRWDLSVFYSGIDDPRLEADLKSYEHGCIAFRNAYKGKLSEKLGAAISAYADLSMLSGKVAIYLRLRQSTDLTDAKVKSKISEVSTRLAASSGEYLTFFDLELVVIDDATLARLKAADPVVAKHWPWIEHARIFKPHLLSEDVETALSKRGPFGPGSWGEFFDEVEADLRFPWDGGEKTLTEILHVMTDSLDAEERFRAMTAVDEVFKGAFEKYAAYALWMTAGSGGVEDKERGYRHPMQSTNMSNRIPDEVVEALHKAVVGVGGPLCRRYYRLKAAHLGTKTLRWSDRNAKMPFDDASVVPFAEAQKMVLEAYASFSPTLAGLIGQAFDEKRIDAPHVPGKEGGAFNMSTMLPDGVPRAFTFLNYLGSNRDVMTLAHEVGHGVHGVLAGEAQGPLMFRAPMAYAETASVFGEMTTYNALKAKLLAHGDKKALLALVMGKLDDMMNTQIRQISFSNFERRMHAAGRRLSPEELTAIWMDVTRELYGAEGEVFTYDRATRLWAYISHFYRPFYVYAYAVGDLFTQSLYAKREALGGRFEPLYLELLRAGSTRGAVELLAPFGLDPTDPAFWKAGLEVGMKTLLEEAERLSAEMGVRP